MDRKGKVAINIDKSGSEVEAGGKKMLGGALERLLRG